MQNDTNYGQCAKCGLALPNFLLIPVIARTPQGNKNVYVCSCCAGLIKKQKG